MFLELDGIGSIQLQIAKAIKQAIVDGRLRPDARLPPTRELAEELGVSRNTVMGAYERLRSEGIVEGKVGAGSFICQRLKEVGRKTNGEPVHRLAPSQYAEKALNSLDERAKDEGNIPARHMFRYGLPITAPALMSAWSKKLSQAACYASTNYPDPQGLEALRECIVDYLKRLRGVHASSEDVLIVSGAQQAVALTARVLIDKGDVVAIEDPHYDAVRTILKAYGANLIGVPVDGDGIQTHLLPSGRPKLICTTPSHQFPTGSILSLSRRKELLEYASRTQSWIFEDDYDGEFRFDNKPIPALRSIDDEGRVIYVGTFSKSLSPSFRMGFMIMPAKLRDAFIGAKWLEDFGASTIDQFALSRFMQDGSFERHLRRTIKELRRRRAALVSGLSAASDVMSVVDSKAGMHAVGWLHRLTPDQGERFIGWARENGVGLSSVGPYYLGPRRRAGVLLGYASMSVPEIRDASRQLVRVLRDFHAVERLS